MMVQTIIHGNTVHGKLAPKFVDLAKEISRQNIELANWLCLAAYKCITYMEKTDS